MKETDYAPRVAPFDNYLSGSGMIGVEIGVDVGAHADAMLTYCNISKLHLVDVWDREFYLGWCKGRLFSKGYKHKVEFMQLRSTDAAKQFGEFSLDFVYIDITHDGETVTQSLNDWWPKLKHGGFFGYRNYSENGPYELKSAVDVFVREHNIESNVEMGEIVLLKK